ncbi:MAG: hypothetical protein ABSE96_20510 [Terracidiphilus sp.]|jgi:hypothetical protein
MEIEELKQCKEAEEGSGDSCPQPGCDADGFPNAEQFASAIAEASADVDPNNFNEDFEPLEHDDSRETMFNTLPELKMIHHNLGL